MIYEKKFREQQTKNVQAMYAVQNWFKIMRSAIIL